MSSNREGRAVSPDQVVDRLVLAFRWGVLTLATLHLLVFRDPRALVIAGTAVLANLIGVLAAREQRRWQSVVHVAQIALDTTSMVWLVQQLTTTDAPVWTLLLLPVIEGSIRFRMTGALLTLGAGLVAVNLIHPAATMLEAGLHGQLSLVVVTVAIGLMSQQLETRLGQLARSRAETARRATLLSVVANAARTVTAPDPARVLEAVADSALQLGFDMAEICLADSDARTLVPVVQLGWPEHHPPASQPWDSGAAGRAFQTEQTVVVSDYQTWEHALPLHLQTGIARSAAAAPVRLSGEVTAVLCVANHEPRDLTAYERECLELLATQAGVALRNAQVHTEREAHQRELEHKATHDPLTQLENRSSFVAALEARLVVAGETTVTVMFIDLDGFKEVNDTLGHSVGDQLLVLVADRLRAALRPGDVIARFGGDEFTVMLGGDPDDADAIADRLLASLSKPAGIEGALVPVGGSIGMARSVRSDDVDALLRRADEAMYRAKTAGRGCVSR